MGCGLGFGVQIERGAPLAKYNGIRLPQGLPFFFFWGGFRMFNICPDHPKMGPGSLCPVEMFANPSRWD